MEPEPLPVLVTLGVGQPTSGSVGTMRAADRSLVAADTSRRSRNDILTHHCPVTFIEFVICKKKLGVNE